MTYKAKVTDVRIYLPAYENYKYVNYMFSADET